MHGRPLELVESFFSQTAEHERHLGDQTANELWQDELQLHRHIREELDDVENLVEERLKEDNNVRPCFTVGDRVDGLVPDVGVQIVTHHGLVVGREQRREEADGVEGADLCPAVEANTNEGRCIILVRAGAEMQKRLGKTALLCNEGDIADEEESEDDKSDFRR